MLQLKNYRTGGRRMEEFKFQAWDGKAMHENVAMIYGKAIKHAYSAIAYIDAAKAGIPRLFTGLHDKKGREIYVGHILHCNYMGYVEFNAVVRLGEYNQDGSGGEYTPTKCIGFYAEAINKCQEDDWGCRVVPDYLETTSLLSFENIEVIGSVYENPKLLEGENQ